MLTKRIIPCLDVKDGKVVKGINFVGLKELGDPVELAKKYYEQGADELVFLDITATHEKRDTIVDLVEQVAKTIYIPFTVGGGIRTIEDIRKILLAGADKVSLNSAAVKNPQLIEEGAKMFGNQCIVLALDAKRRKDDTGWNVVVNGGRIDTGLDAIEKQGFDLPLCRSIRNAVPVPVIASGGCGKLEDFLKVFETKSADAALAASLFHYGELKVQDVKAYLESKGVVVRP